MAMKMVVDARIHAVDVLDESFLQIAQRAEYGRGVEDSARTRQGFV